MKAFVCSFLILLGFHNFAHASVFTAFTSTDVLASFRRLAIQDGGRVKPLDTFARESLNLVYGKETYDGKPALEVVTTWFLDPRMWEDRPFVEIRYNLVKKALKFDETRKLFSLKEIMASDRLSYVFQELQSKRETKAKLDPYFQALQRLESQMGVFRGIATGELLRLVPPPALKAGEEPSSTSSLWLSPSQWNEEQQKSFAEVNKAFVAYLGSQAGNPDDKATDKALADRMNQATADFTLAAQKGSDSYPNKTKIDAEIFYNQFHPFQKAWILYLLTVLSILLLWVLKRPFFYKFAWTFALTGLCFHIFGFALRVYLTGRPPVSNMYETVTWVSFGALIFSMVIEAIYRWRFILLAGAAVAGFCLILADYAPVILDPSLQPLEAVLNSNFWLTTHVLTITISYAAFFLAFALGDLGLFFYFRGESENSPRLRAITLSIYRAIQIGVSLLAPGIILGGIWADYSWGRFWGWDPKETWALIALLGYIAVLHARMGGLIRGFGLVASAVVAFSLVIMAWYGVNYILGAGLHSYGFGAGGVEYVATFVGVHLMAVIFVSVLHHSRKNSLKV
jgi:cytochrome c-type biogenesis protein CcsB